MEANSKWQVSGGAAELYEENLVPVIFIPWAQELLNRAELIVGEAVLDAACGTGIVARMASDLVGPDAKVVGADINAGMLTVARSKSKEEGKQIDWVEADVGSLPFGDASFDAVFCQQGLQFFPDKISALKEFRRVLTVSGRCVICVAQSLEHNPLMNGQIEILTRYIGEDAANAIRAVCSLSDSSMIHDLFAEAGFPKSTLRVSHSPCGTRTAKLLWQGTCPQRLPQTRSQSCQKRRGRSFFGISSIPLAPTMTAKPWHSRMSLMLYTRAYESGIQPGKATIQNRYKDSIAIAL